jgi:hypothetical protein
MGSTLFRLVKQRRREGGVDAFGTIWLIVRFTEVAGTILKKTY